jgi:hypothetical protein
VEKQQRRQGLSTATTELAGYFFPRNDLGWRIAPAAQDYEIWVSGDLYP